MFLKKLILFVIIQAFFVLNCTLAGACNTAYMNNIQTKTLSPVLQLRTSQLQNVFQGSIYTFSAESDLSSGISAEDMMQKTAAEPKRKMMYISKAVSAFFSVLLAPFSVLAGLRLNFSQANIKTGFVPLDSPGLFTCENLSIALLIVVYLGIRFFQKKMLMENEVKPSFYDQWQELVSEGTDGKRALNEIFKKRYNVDFKVDDDHEWQVNAFLELIALTVDRVPDCIWQKSVKTFAIKNHLLYGTLGGEEPGVYLPKQKKIIITPKSFCFYDLYGLQRVILHEIGHAFESSLSPKEFSSIKKEYKLIHKKYINGYRGYKLFLSADNKDILTMQNRIALRAYLDDASASQFVAEFFRQFLLNRNDLDELIEGQSDLEVKRALRVVWGIYHERLAGAAEQTDGDRLNAVYGRLKDRMFLLMQEEYAFLRSNNKDRGMYERLFLSSFGLPVNEYEKLSLVADSRLIHRAITERIRGFIEKKEEKNYPLRAKQSQYVDLQMKSCLEPNGVFLRQKLIEESI